MESNSVVTPQDPSRSAEFWTGLKAEFPLMVGVVPFGVIYGALAVKAGIPSAAAQAMSSIIFAGSAQFLTAQMTAAAVPGMVMILAILVINLRHALYSASVAPYIQKLSTWWKVVLAYFMTDEAYVVTITHFDKFGTRKNSHWFFLAAGAGLWVSWQLSTAVGVFLGEVIPPSWPLDFALPLTFIAMVVPALKDKASVGAAIAAGFVAVVAFGLPYKLSIVAGALVGILAGVLLERRK